MKKILLFFLCILTMPIMLDASSMNGGDLPLPLLPKIDPTKPNDPNQKSPVALPGKKDAEGHFTGERTEILYEGGIDVVVP